MVPAGACLLAGIVGGLVLLDVLPEPMPALAQSHGLVMTLGFLGTVIALERAVALGRPWGYLAPVALGGGGLSALLVPAQTLSSVLLVLGSAVLVGVYAALWRRQGSAALAVQSLAAVMALGAATLAALGAPVSVAVPWLAGFVVLTIAGERAELAVLMSTHIGSRVLVASAGVSIGVFAATLWPSAGSALLGAGVIVLTAVLAGTDVARKTVRGTGLPRFAAAAMLAGYAWLGVAGIIWLVGAEPGPRAYDAVIHAVFLGFAMSMVMAHAPIILPAVLGRALPYSPAMYVPLVTLHAGLAIRLLGGDAYGLEVWHDIGGVVNVIALLAFALVTVVSATRGGRRSGGTAAGTPSARRAVATTPAHGAVDAHTAAGAGS